MRKKVRSGKKMIVFQVKVALDSIDYIGQSKRAFRRQGIKGIHTYKQKKNTFSDCQNFVKWVRQHYQITVLQQLSPNTIMPILHSCRKRDAGMDICRMSRRPCDSYKWQCKRVERDILTFCPEKRLFSGQSKLQIRNRSYTDKEIELIKENCSEEVRKGGAAHEQFRLTFKRSRQPSWQAFHEKGR